MGFGKGHGSMATKLKIFRLVLSFLNLTFIISGLALVVIGLCVIHQPKLQKLRPLMNPETAPKTAPALSNAEIFSATIILIGAIIITLGFIGCCGIMRGFRLINLFYGISLAIMILAEAILILLCIVYQYRLQTKLVDHLQDSIATYYVGMPNSGSTPVNSISLAWDYAQFHMKCCGALGRTDYLQSVRWNRTDPQGSNMKLLVPYSCCPTADSTSWNSFSTHTPEIMHCTTTGMDAYSEGCYHRLKDILISYKNYFILGLSVIGFTQILALISTACLYYGKKRYNSL